MIVPIMINAIRYAADGFSIQYSLSLIAAIIQHVIDLLIGECGEGGHGHCESFLKRFRIGVFFYDRLGVTDIFI